MAGELNDDLDFETIYDSKFRPDLASARDVLAFVLTPLQIVVDVPPGEQEEAAAMFFAAKQDACERWLKLRKGARPV